MYPTHTTYEAKKYRPHNTTCQNESITLPNGCLCTIPLRYVFRLRNRHEELTTFKLRFNIVSDALDLFGHTCEAASW